MMKKNPGQEDKRDGKNGISSQSEYMSSNANLSGKYWAGDSSSSLKNYFT